MLTNEKILLLLEKLADGAPGLQSFFYGLGFDAQNRPLPVPDAEDWAGWLRAQPRLVAIEDHSRLAALWFPVRGLSDDVQKKIRRHYGARFPAALFLFETKDQTWAWELSTPSVGGSCSFHLSQVNQPLLHAVRALYLADDELLDIPRLAQVAQALGAAGNVEVSDRSTRKTPWKPLTAGEEKELAKAVERGGVEGAAAQETLVSANVRLVTSIALKYLNRGVEFDDLLQEGRLGLLRAVRKYDWRKGYRFSTYATHWIRQALGRAVENDGRIVRLPSHFQKTMYRVLKAQDRLTTFLNREPTAEELAAETGRLTKDVRLILTMLGAKPLSFDAPIPGSGLCFGDIIPAPAKYQPERLSEAAALREAIEESLGLLDKHEAQVLTMRFGLDAADPEPKALEAIGQALGLSRERARQIEQKALTKLREKPVGACLRNTVLGTGEDRPKPATALTEQESKKRGRKPKPCPASSVPPPAPTLPAMKSKKRTADEERELYIRQKRQRNLLFKQQRQATLPEAQESPQDKPVIEELAPEAEKPKLSLFSEDELREATAPAVAPLETEALCEECGFPVERPTLGGRFYRCKFCKNVGLL
jgi:RNA polymerase primary sigma factor